MTRAPPPEVQAIVFAGQPLWLLPDGAALHPPSRTLFVADLHLGKAAAFRSRGLPVPAGTTLDNLRRLARLVHAWQASRLVLLGDLLHSVQAQQSVMDALRRWRASHAALDCVLVRGNHDRHAGDPPADLALRVVDEPWPVDGAQGLVACHHPQPMPGQGVLAGHRHPVLTLSGPGRDRQRLPCFCLADAVLVLPAFGVFTGGSSLPPPAGSTCYPVGAGRVWPGLRMR